MINENFTRNLMQNLKRLGDINDMIASRKKIRRPSDDPVSAAVALKLRRQIAAIEQYNSNAQDAITWMKDTETALANTGDILHRLNELTIQAANGPLTPDDRQKILYEVKELKDQIFQEANSTSINRHLFSGYNTDKPPFIKDGDKVIPNPDVMRPNGLEIINVDGEGITDSIKIDLHSVGDEVAIGQYRIRVTLNEGSDDNPTANIEIFKLDENGELKEGDPVTFSNKEIVDGNTIEIKDPEQNWDFVLNFGVNSITDNSPMDIDIQLTLEATEYNLSQSERVPVNLLGFEIFADIFETVERLETAIEENDTTTISDQILEDIKDSTGIILKYRAQIGARSNRLEATVLRLDANEVDYLELLSNTEDIDLARMITELKMEESVYRASLSVGARIIQPSLVDFLR